MTDVLHERTGLTMPCDKDAELTVLGSMMLSREDADFAMNAVEPEDFYWPSHRRLFLCCSDLRRAGHVPGITAARDWLRAHPDPTAVTDSLLNEALTAGGTSALRRSAEIVQECGARRAAMLGSNSTIRMAADPAVPLNEVADQARSVTDAVALPSSLVKPGPDVDTFLAGSEDYDWLVPDYIERADRVLLTGWTEGGGKTVLMRQLAMQAASGIVWFTSTRTMDPLRVLYVDAENGIPINRRWFRSLRITAGHSLDGAADRLAIQCVPSGLDLTTKHDRSWLTGVVEANRPQLLVIGPLYKMHTGDPNSEGDMRQLAAYLDALRERYGVAMLLEAHTPNEQGGNPRSLRPIGSSIWRRWCEFGVALREPEPRRYEIRPWKARDDRGWRLPLERGGQWPWSVRVQAKLTGDDGQPF